MTASFEIAFNATMGHEGGYVNDPDDRGGETFRGISKVHHPDWSGWFTISDAIAEGLPIPDLDLLVMSFYKKQYWDKFDGDKLPQAIANELFDTAVNMGTRIAVRFLQKSLNVANRNQSLFPDLTVDGKYGAKTGTAVNALTNESDFILKLMNVLQGARYIEIMAKNLPQEKYARGWFNRVQIGKDNSH